jgi:putative tryptophan/tyrosine transport system substrate-binding protein
MRRRDFIAGFGGAVAWPLAARAQQSGKGARIGFLGAGFASDMAYPVELLRSGLRELGYVEGVNLIITYRWAEDRYERLPRLAAELVRSNVGVIVTYGTPGTLAAKQATTTIPIVVATIGDPVAAGIVASVARPGGNVTGQSFFYPELSAKRIELLKEILPKITRVAHLFNLDNPPNGPEAQLLEIAAQHMKVELQQLLCGDRTNSRAPSRQWNKEVWRRSRWTTMRCSLTTLARFRCLQHNGGYSRLVLRNWRKPAV